MLWYRFAISWNLKLYLTKQFLISIGTQSPMDTEATSYWEKWFGFGFFFFLSHVRQKRTVLIEYLKDTNDCVSNQYR